MLYPCSSTTVLFALESRVMALRYEQASGSLPPTKPRLVTAAFRFKAVSC